MGYQQAVPPIPTRDQEQHMIEKFEQSWIDQPWNRYYMNENLRIPKMRRQYKREYVRKQLIWNMLFYSVLFAPLLYVSKRLFITRNGLPYYMDVKYNDVVVKAHKARKRHFATFALPSYLLGVFMAAKLSTDRSPVVDYNISQFHDEKWL